MPVDVSTPQRALVFLALGAAGLCAASVASAVAVTGEAGNTPGRRAILQWLPIAAAVFFARFLGNSQIALGLVFGTSVGVLSTVVGSLCAFAPIGPAPPRWKRLWPFTLAAALIVFVSGFNGLLNWRHGFALSLEGLVIFALWHDRTSEHEWSAPFPASDPPPLIGLFGAWVIAGGGVILGMAGIWAATRGAMALDRHNANVAASSVASAFLSVMLITPMLQSGRRLALAGASWIPMTASIAVVLLNLCLLLPALAAVPYLAAFPRIVHHGTRLVIDWKAYAPNVTFFPLHFWRIDCAAIVLLSMFFLPVSVGKWNLGREEGLLLIIAYCVYLLAATVGGM